MKESTTVFPIALDPMRDLYEQLRSRVREGFVELLEAELCSALGAGRHERSQARRGYRHGSEEREISTEGGTVLLEVPRGRVFAEDGKTSEFQSKVLPRYQRRTARVEEAILGCYLGGINTRRARRALEGLLGDENLSKSAISRVVQRLKDRFFAWQSRDLSSEYYAYLYFDATNLRVRVGKRVVKLPVLVVLGVREDGQKVLVTLEVAGRESKGSWESLVNGLSKRGLRSPKLAILDGLAGLVSVVEDVWAACAVQRCVVHKLRNLMDKAPKHIQQEVKRDFDAIVYAKDKEVAQRAYAAFVKKWAKEAKSVVDSLEEAGEKLLTFFDFPKSQWKSLRTTNGIERVNAEFKRRTKTQGSFCNETSALVLLFGMVALGQLRFRRIDGWCDMPQVLAGVDAMAA